VTAGPYQTEATTAQLRASAQLPLSAVSASGQRLPPGSAVVLMMENHSYDNYLGLLVGRGAGAGAPRDR